MTQYIDKDALVAEIDRLIEKAKAERVLYPKTILSAKNLLLLEDYDRLKKIIDKIEVKEVDLEKEFDDYTKDIMACDIQFEPFTHMYNCAKHFFELGLKAQKEE